MLYCWGFLVFSSLRPCWLIIVPPTASGLLRWAEPPAAPQLELKGFSWHTEYGYAILEGQVTNVSSQPLKNVTAVASFYDAKGGFITSSEALIEYNPILPGQTSPFSVGTTENPAMEKAAVDFKDLLGGTIPFRKASREGGKKK